MKNTIIGIFLIGLISCNSRSDLRESLIGSWKLIQIEFAYPEIAENIYQDSLVFEIRFNDSVFFIDRSSYYGHSSHQTWTLNDSTIQIIRREILGTDTTNWRIFTLNEDTLSLGIEDRTLHFKKLKKKKPDPNNK